MRRLIKTRILPAEKVGRRWQIDSEDVARIVLHGIPCRSSTTRPGAFSWAGKAAERTATLAKAKPMAYHRPMNYAAAPITVLETRPFVSDASKCMSDTEKEEFISYIARNPEHGDLIQGTGGVRKVRWAVGSKGKSGGVRVIYYFHSGEIPLFLLTAYSKSHKSNISPAEKAAMRQVVEQLIKSFKR